MTGTVGVLGGGVGLEVGLAIGEFAGTLVRDGAGVTDIVAIAGDVAANVAVGVGAGDAATVGLPNITRAAATIAEKSANSIEPRA
jgi:hypothetical protein